MRGITFLIFTTQYEQYQALLSSYIRFRRVVWRKEAALLLIFTTHIYYSYLLFIFTTQSKAAASARTPFLAEVEFYTRIVALSHPLGPSSVPSAQGSFPYLLLIFTTLIYHSYLLLIFTTHILRYGPPSAQRSPSALYY